MRFLSLNIGLLLSGLTAFGAVNVVRGPYLQSGSSTKTVVRWRTDVECNSVVRFGTSSGLLNRAVTNLADTTEHEVQVTGLNVDTKYYYAIGTTTQIFSSGPDYSLRTFPTNTRPFRVWVTGDSGTADANASGVRDGYMLYTGATPTDLWLMLGDNAYGSGFDFEFQAAIFDMYPAQLRNITLFSAIGNHETYNNDPTGFPYLRNFTFPQFGESGGVPSGTELYYSFDYANVHFISLDSMVSDRSSSGAMLSWLREDLAQTTKDWIVAFYHHPAYTKGTHDSDTEIELIEMRQNALPILEEFGVDLVLSGHSHVYERSPLLDHHYGNSSTFAPGNVLDGSFGRADDGGPYRKPAGGLGSHQGAVYVTCGCSGASGIFYYGQHPAMIVNHSGVGSMALDVNGLQLTANFIRPNGTPDDHFTIDKSAPTTVIRPGMRIVRAGDNSVISWPTSNPSYDVKSATVLPETHWQNVPQAAQVIGRSNFVTVPSASGIKFYQLQTP
jgi:acid phosphatase type 7